MDFIERMSVERMSAGSYMVKVSYHGRTYKCHSNDSLAFDRLYFERELEPKERGTDNLTLRQAYRRLYDECCRRNNIGRYKQ